MNPGHGELLEGSGALGASAGDRRQIWGKVAGRAGVGAELERSSD